MSLIARIGTPAIASQLAQVCRRSWKRKFSSFASFAARRNCH
jgi:hypothetical protein